MLTRVLHQARSRSIGKLFSTNVVRTYHKPCFYVCQQRSSFVFNFLFIIVNIIKNFVKFLLWGSHKIGSASYRSIRTSCSSSVQFIWKNSGNYVRFVNMQKPDHTARTFPFVFALKTNKFQFVANWTIHGQRSAGSQSRPHVRAFGSRTVCQWFCELFAVLMNTRL